MKKVFSVLFFSCIIAFTAFSQGTLQFNQVKLVGTTESVPAGKVWKVVSVIAANSLSVAEGTNTVSNSTQIAIDGVTSHIAHCSTWTGPGSGSNANPRPYGYTSAEITQLPIWLPALTTLAAGSNVTKVSVIEFNILP